MKTKIGIFISILLITNSLYAQNIITVEATGYDISDNLDLEAVASLFGKSSDLEEFEQKLNDPKIQISNLDLNQDGYVDYIRVIETSTDRTFLVTLQAVIGENLFQDIATIDIEKDETNTPRVQITGDVYLYGRGYIIEPVFLHVPIIFNFFRGTYHRIWVSPYHWRHYPPRFHAWKPYPVPRYRQNTRGHKRPNISYQYPSKRRSKTALKLQGQTRRNDYGIKHPERSFDRRNKSIRNKQQLDKSRSIRRDNLPHSGNVKSTGRKTWTPPSTSNRTQKTNVTRSSSSRTRQERSGQVRSNSRSQSESTTPRKSNVSKGAVSSPSVKSKSNSRGLQRVKSTTSRKSNVPKSAVSSPSVKSKSTSKTQQTKSSSARKSSVKKGSVNKKTKRSIYRKNRKE